MRARKPTKRDLPLLWDGFMVYLALVNVGLILFDWTYPPLRGFYAEHLPRLVELYDPWHERFWLLDLPFLAFFAAEFFFRWWLSVRRGHLRRWFYFPLVYWYDFLGIIPFYQFRVFRLFRVISIYVRLHRSELSTVGQDPVSRAVSFVADVFTEEISDRVALRILTLAQTEIRSGVLVDVLRKVLLPRREEVRRRVAAKVTELSISPRLKERTRDLLKVSLDEAVAEAPVLRRIPLPDAVLRPLVRSVGEIVFDSVTETLAASLRTPEGKVALEEMVDAVMGSFEAELGRGEIERLIEEAVVDALEEMKAAVEVKRWAETPAERVGVPGGP